MKKLLLTIVLTTALFADINWVYDFGDAKKMAKQENKIVMMFISMEACPICTYMKEKVFPIKSIDDYLNKNFIMYYVDLDLDGAPEGFSVIGTPTSYFIKPNGEVIGKIIGGTKPDYYIKKLEATIK